MRAAVDFPEPYRLMMREEVGSTNDELRALAEQGAPSGFVLVAHRQTGGRGRRGAVWHAQPGESLAFSILLRPTEPKGLWPRLALAAGVSVAEALEQQGAVVGIKWPNDVWIGQKKVGGILVEAGADYVIVGIGLNVNTQIFPEEVASIATSMQIELGKKVALSDVLAAVVSQFAMHCTQINEGFETLIDRVRQRCVLSGHYVSYMTAGGQQQGWCEGIASGGELTIRGEEGLRHLLQADEIRILR